MSNNRLHTAASFITEARSRCRLPNDGQSDVRLLSLLQQGIRVLYKPEQDMNVRTATATVNGGVATAQFNLTVDLHVVEVTCSTPLGSATLKERTAGRQMNVEGFPSTFSLSSVSSVDPTTQWTMTLTPTPTVSTVVSLRYKGLYSPTSTTDTTIMDYPFLYPALFEYILEEFKKLRAQ